MSRRTNQLRYTSICFTILTIKHCPRGLIQNLIEKDDWLLHTVSNDARKSINWSLEIKYYQLSAAVV